MKMIVVLALVGAALAEPEADPLYYSGYGLRSVGYPISGYSGYTGLGYAGSYIKPAFSPYTRGIHGLHGIYKREAEAEAEPAAEPEADPLLYSSYGVHPYGGVASTYSGLASPFVRSVYNPVKTYGSVVAPVSTYRSSVIPAYTGYTGYTGYHGLGKREAEAEPYTVYGRPAYTGYTGYTGYNTGYSGYNMGYSRNTGYPLRSIHQGLGYSNLWG